MADKNKKSVGLRTRKPKSSDTGYHLLWGKEYTAKHKLEKTSIPKKDRPKHKHQKYGLPFGEEVKEIKFTPARKKIKNIIKRKVKKLIKGIPKLAKKGWN